MEAFETELAELLKKHGIENMADMQAGTLAGMLCRMIAAMGPGIRQSFAWHGYYAEEDEQRYAE